MFIGDRNIYKEWLTGYQIFLKKFENKANVIDRNVGFFNIFDEVLCEYCRI